MSAQIPANLHPGDTIAIICPSGYMPFDKAKVCINTLSNWGYKVKIGKTLGNQFQYFSGTDEERLADLQMMLDDDEVNAILCGRGGYGLSRIIDQVDFRKFRNHPKWIIGYSDITLLHAHVLSRYNTASIHAPMAAAFSNEGYKNEYVLSLKKILAGEKMNYTCNVHEFNKTGTATGQLAGGNLALLCHICGTPSDIRTKKKLLFIEDVGEYIYNLDRMLYQLKRSGKFDNLAGLVIGGFADTKDTTIPFGKSVYEIVRDIVSEYDYPVCFQFPVGHANENYALKIGAECRLTITDTLVQLEEVDRVN